MEKKQKILLILLAVAVLGAGSMYFMGSSNKSDTTVSTKPLQRRQKTVKPVEIEKRVVRKRPVDGIGSMLERREGKGPKKKTKVTRRINRKKEGKVKKAKLVPAA